MHWTNPAHHVPVKDESSLEERQYHPLQPRLLAPPRWGRSPALRGREDNVGPHFSSSLVTRDSSEAE